MIGTRRIGGCACEIHSMTMWATTMLVLVLLYLQIALSSAVKSGNSVPNDFSLGKNASASSIVGGRPAAARRYPFMVQSSPSNCGGTLIHEDIVLSAAHCGGSFLSGVTIGGILRDGSDSEFFDVDSECLHPDYETAIIHDINDIMLIKLSTPSTAPLIKLNLDNPSIPARKEVLTAIGFGRTESGGFTSPVLLQVNLDTYPDASCEKQYSDYVPETLLCAGTAAGGKDTCQGDSGGPIMTKSLVQVGVTSYGDGCGGIAIPAVYTEVSSFASFIRNGICSLSSNPPASCVDSETAAFTCLVRNGGFEDDFFGNETETVAPVATPAPTQSSSPQPAPRAPTKRPTRAVAKQPVPTPRVPVVARPTPVATAPRPKPVAPKAVATPVAVAPRSRPTAPKATRPRPTSAPKTRPKTGPASRPVTVVLPRPFPTTIVAFSPVRKRVGQMGRKK